MPKNNFNFDELDSNPYSKDFNDNYNNSLKYFKKKVASGENISSGNKLTANTPETGVDAALTRHAKEVGSQVTPQEKASIIKGWDKRAAEENERKLASEALGVNLNKNWYDELSDESEWAKDYKEDALKVNPEKAQKIIQALEDYSKESQRGFITRSQLDKFANQLGLRDLSDRELRQMWSDVHNVAGYYGYGQKDRNKSNKILDAQSAFAEVVNEEARRRKAAGNYFPYDENDIEGAKDRIKEIASKHEGYDGDSWEGYFSNDELDEVKQLANEYHLTDDDLAKISYYFNKDFYPGNGWKQPAEKTEPKSNPLDKIKEYGKQPIFEKNGQAYGIEYDPETNKLYAGGITNSGIMREYEIDYDEDMDLDRNLEELYDMIEDGGLMDEE